MLQYNRAVEVYDEYGELQYVGQAVALSTTADSLYVTVERVCPDNEDFLELAEVGFSLCRFPRLIN